MTSSGAPLARGWVFFKFFLSIWSPGVREEPFCSPVCLSDHYHPSLQKNKNKNPPAPMRLRLWLHNLILPLFCFYWTSTSPHLLKTDSWLKVLCSMLKTTILSDNTVDDLFNSLLSCWSSDSKDHFFHCISNTDFYCHQMNCHHQQFITSEVFSLDSHTTFYPSNSLQQFFSLIKTFKN